MDNTRNARDLLLTTAINPDLLNSVYLRESEEIVDITILTVDYKPIQLTLGTKFHSKASDIISIYDVAALVVKYKNKDGTDSEIKTKFVMAEDIMRVSNKSGDLIMLNGKFDIIPDKLLVEIYKNFSNLKTVDLTKLEDILDISKNNNQPALKAYNQLSNYFSPENYLKNNNVFKLLQHQNEAIKISKKILLKSIVAWEIRK